MISAEAVAVVLLAAGTSTRFGPGDKLATPLNGLALGLHPARTFGRLPFAARIVVTSRDGPDFAPFGFVPVINPDPGTGQSGSIRLGLAEARLVQPRAVLIALADMPYVTIAHVDALMARFEDESSVIGSTDGTRLSPPAMFGASLFEALETLSGDAGARKLLQRGTLVAAPASELADIDTPLDFGP